MEYSHLRLNIHDFGLYIIAMLLFILLLFLLYCVYRYMDKVVTRSAYSSRKASLKQSSQHDFYLLGEAQPEIADRNTPDLSVNTDTQMDGIVIERLSPILSEHEKEILEIHCEECENIKHMIEDEKEIPYKTTIFLP